MKWIEDFRERHLLPCRYGKAEAKDKYVRLTDILEILQIGERSFLENTEEIVYSEIQQKLNAYRDNSLKFLNDIILKQQEGGS